MVFSSFDFLFYFIPCFFASYFLMENRYKNFIILIYSLIFYAFGCFDNIYYVAIVIFSLIYNYFIAICIEKTKYKKFLLIVALILNFSTLFIFKYLDFFLRIIHIVNPSINKQYNLVLPIGISFYTFQIVSYVIDVYFQKIKAEKNFIDFGTYVMMFPQLIAGPILRYTDIMKEIKCEHRIITKKNIYDGICIFIIGLSSKVIIANQLSLVKVDLENYSYETMSTLASWFGAFSFSVQMYFDFFGYSLMSIGLGKIMGFTIIKNFDDPFLSKSIEEYWRRWHISLSTWFRDYLLYPLLFSRPLKNLRKCLTKIFNSKFSNICVNIIATFFVWAATGLWHGANFNFVLWGLLFFVLLNIEQIGFCKFLEKHKIFSHIYLCVMIMISFVIFTFENLHTIKLFLFKMFCIDTVFINDIFFQTIANNWKSIVVATLFVLKIPNIIYDKLKTNCIINSIIMIIIFSISIYLIYCGYNDPFMYFRF